LAQYHVYKNKLYLLEGRLRQLEAALADPALPLPKVCRVFEKWVKLSPISPKLLSSREALVAERDRILKEMAETLKSIQEMRFSEFFRLKKNPQDPTARAFERYVACTDALKEF